MKSEIENVREIPPAGQGLEGAARLLAEELRAARVETQAQRQRLRALTLALGLGLATLGGWVIPALIRAEPPEQSMLKSVSLDADPRAAQRAKLLTTLPPDRRRELESFERELTWLRDYMQTWDQGQAGAVAALMLFKMAQSMSSMPEMQEQMRTMSGQMGALPAIVAELSAINAKMHAIAASMDSTMGRAGRMMPWMPFAP